MSIAKRIRDGRYAKGWGPDELARRADISRTALYQIECGKTETPRAGTLQRIAGALGVSIDALMGRRESDGSEATTPLVESHPPTIRPVVGTRHNGAGFTPRAVIMSDRELDRKFHDLLASPLGEGLARLVEESHRLLPAREVG